MFTKEELEKRTATKGELKIVRGFCAQCSNGPHPINCYVVNGVLTKIEPNRELAPYLYCPEGRLPCARYNNLLQKVYNPNRVKAPMKRTNPKKGRGIDPGWQEISWDEALDIVAGKLREIRQKGLVDENGHPRLGIHMGTAGMGHVVGSLLDAFMTAWGPIDPTFQAAGGIRCYGAEHAYGEMWHRSLLCWPDIDRVRWLLSLGRNDYSTWAQVAQHLGWRGGGFKRIHIDPYLTTTAALSDEWIPIKPMTDLALLLAMTHVILYEMDWRKVCDIDFLKNMTSSPYLIGPNGYYVRDPKTKKPFIWDPVDGKAKSFDADDIKDFALEGKYQLEGIEIGPDEEVWEVSEGRVSFELLIESMRDYTPEWASEICEIRAETIRRLAKEFVDNAMVGATIEMEGRRVPYRPVFIGLGKNIANGPGAYQAELTYHILTCLVGALEVPGSHMASETLLAPGPPGRDPDGFLEFPLTATDKKNWQWQPEFRSGPNSLCPVLGPYPYVRGELGPNHLTYMGIDEGGFPGWPVKAPDVLISYKSNAPITVLDPERVERVFAKIPFHVRFAFEFDESALFADVLLPENMDLEATQIWLAGGRKSMTDYLVALGRFPAVKPFNTMEIADISTELAARVGILAEYNAAINEGAATRGIPFREPDRLELDRKYTVEEIHERAASAMTNGEHGLDFFRETGGYVIPYAVTFEPASLGNDVAQQALIRPLYLCGLMAEKKMRYEFPYQGRLRKMYAELGRRLHEKEIYWWDERLEEFTPLPEWRDVAITYDTGPEYDLWAVTSRSGMFAWSTVSFPISYEVLERKLGHLHVQINSETAKKRGIKDEDEIYVESAYGKVKGRAKLREGLHADTIVILGAFGHWATPVAKEIGERIPNINRLSKMDLKLMSEDGGVRDTVRVKVYKATE